MATASVKLKEITCSMCCQIYKDPYSLKCGHAYCCACIYQRKRRKRIQCLQCDVNSSISEITKDEHSRELFSIFRSEQEKALYMQLAHSNYQSEICESYNCSESGHCAGPTKLQMIKDKIWCAVAPDGIFIFDTQSCKLERKILFDTPHDVNGFAILDTGNIVIASSNWNPGLYVITSSGKDLCQIADGSFSNVCLYNNKLYTLHLQTMKVSFIIFTSSDDGNWVQQTTKELFISEFDNFRNTRILVSDFGVYLSTYEAIYNNLCLQVYSLKLELLMKKGIEGSKKPGSFRRCYLCNVDSLGNALVSDSFNNCVQVYNWFKDQWYIIAMQGLELRYTDNVITQSEAKSLWVVKCQQVEKYTAMVSR